MICVAVGITQALQQANSVSEHLQGQYLTFGMLRTSRDWINSALTIGIGGSLAAVYYGSKTLRHTRSQSRHEAALRDLNK
jgi:hypothetical protein